MSRKNMSGRDFLRCLLGHDWNKVESERDFVKSTGMDILFFTSAEQKGVQECARCGRRRKVWRPGFCGAGGCGSEWMKLTPGKEKEIDALPTL